jgi:two-component system LytT family response regulator
LGIFCFVASAELCFIKNNKIKAMNAPSIFIGGRQTINPHEVIRLQADVNYTYVFFSDGKKIVVATTLKELENRFSTFPKFFRISKSQIINIDCINTIQNEQIVLKNGESCRPSRRRKKAFFEIFNH